MRAKTFSARARLAAVLPALLVGAPLGAQSFTVAAAAPSPVRFVAWADSVRPAALSDTVTARCAIGAAGAEFGEAQLAAARACAFGRIARRVQARLGVIEAVRWDSTASAFVTAGADTATMLPVTLRFGITGDEVRAHAVLGTPSRVAPAAPKAALPATPTAAPVAPVPPRVAPTSTTRIPLRAARDTALAKTAPAPAPVASLVRPAEKPVEKLAAKPVEMPAEKSVEKLVAVAPVVASHPAPVTPVPVTPVPVTPAAVTPAPVASAPVRPARVSSTVSPAAAPVVALRMTGPEAARAIIGRTVPTGLFFTLTDTVSGDRLTRGIAGACLARRGGGEMKVTAKLGADGVLACSVVLGEDAKPREAYVVEASFKVGSRRVSRTITVSPIDAPTYAVRATSGECKALEARVLFLLKQRGVPVVSVGKADRVAALQSCQPFDRILPAKSWEVAPSGVLVLGEIAEKGVDPFDQPGRTGGFSVESTKPGADPLAEAAEQIVQKLLKYLAL